MEIVDDYAVSPVEVAGTHLVIVAPVVAAPTQMVEERYLVVVDSAYKVQRGGREGREGRERKKKERVKDRVRGGGLTRARPSISQQRH